MSKSSYPINGFGFTFKSQDRGRWLTPLTLYWLTMLSTVNAFAGETSWQWDRTPVTSFQVVAEAVTERSEASGRGLYWDLLKAVYEPLNIHIKIATASRRHAQTLVANYRKYLAIAGEYRDAPILLRYPRYPLEDESLIVLARKHTASAITLDSLDQWQGLNVSWRRDKDLIIASQYGFQLKQYDAIEEGVDLLLSELTDLVIAQQHLIQPVLQNRGLSVSDFHLETFPQAKSVYLGFQSGSVSEAFIEIYNRGIERLARQGKLETIYERWQAKIPKVIQALTQPD